MRVRHSNCNRLSTVQLRIYFSLDVISAFVALYSSNQHKGKISLKTWLSPTVYIIAEYWYTSTVSASLVSHCCLLWSCLQRQQKPRHKTASRVEKFNSTMAPTVSHELPLPRENFMPFVSFVSDSHAWNSLILKDNVMDAIRCKEWPIFGTGVTGRLRPDCTLEEETEALCLSAATLTCFQLHYRGARWLSGGFHKVTWLSLFLSGAGGHLTVGSRFRWQQEDGWSRGFWDG